MARHSALLVQGRTTLGAPDVAHATVDVVLRHTPSALVVTPGAELCGDALYTLLVALAEGCTEGALVVDLTNVFPTENALRAVRQGPFASAGRGCEIRLVDERSVGRRRISRIRGAEYGHVYASIESAIGAS